jgi:hypothetical protein
MALEIRHNIEQTHENEAFRRVAILLEAFFRENNWNGLLIGNPYTEGFDHFKPDAILFTPHAAVIIDLKEYKGELALPDDSKYENERWLINGTIPVWGGSSINPFCQIGKLKKTYSEILLKSKSKNPKAYSELQPEEGKKDRTKGLVIFSGPITFKDQRRIPGFYKWFSIADEVNLLNKVKDFNEGIEFDNQIGSFLKSIFRAEPYKIHHNVVTSVNTGFDYRFDLWNEQKEVLGHVKQFLLQQKNRILIIGGPEKSGKSVLIPSITSLCYELKINQVNHLVATSRIANRINSIQKGIQFHSVYGAIYGGEPIKEVNDLNPDEDSDEDDETLDIIPILNDKDWSNTSVIIVDEAQLISDSLHQSELMRFGSGKLLTDFINFLRLAENTRKLILIGDPSQLTFGDQELSSLKSEVLKEISKVDVSSIHISTSKPFHKHSRIGQNLQLAESIRTNNFSRLQFFESENVHILNVSQIYDRIQEWLSNNLKFVVLSFSNEEADEINRKIRTEILKRKGEVDSGDLLILHNTIRVLNTDPLSKPRYLNNAAIIKVVRDLGKKEETVYRKNKQSHKLIFRDLEVTALGETIHFNIKILENFRVSPRAKPSTEDALAFRIFINRRLSQELKKNPFESSFEFSQLNENPEWKSSNEKLESLKKELTAGQSVKTQINEVEKKIRILTATAKRRYRYHFRYEFIKHDPFAQSAFVRFGWSMTVHKAMGEHWPYVVVNTQMGNNARKNLAYFQWLYSAISRSESEVFLLNNKNHHPLSDTILDETPAAHLDSVMPKPAGKRSTFEILEASPEFVRAYFAESIPKSAVDYGFSLFNFLKNQDFTILDIESKTPWLVKIKGKDSARTNYTLIFNYNQKGIPTPIRSEGKSSASIQAFLKSLERSEESDQIFPSPFRNEMFDQWKAALKHKGWLVSAVNSFEWLDRYWISKNDSWCVYDCYFNADQFISTIKIHKISHVEIWNEIVPILKGIFDEQA